MSKYKLIKKYPGLPSWAKEGDTVEVVLDAGLYTYSSPGYLFNVLKNEVENFPEFWEKVEELCVPIGTKFRHHKSDTLYTIEEYKDQKGRVKVTWDKGEEEHPYSLHAANLHFKEGRWVKVEEEKDYEILSYRNTKTKEILKRVGKDCYKDSYFVLHRTTLESSNLYEIYSVKRISDGEIFTIGDKVRIKKLKHDGSFIIDEFYFDCNNDKLLCNGRCTGNGHVSINKIEKVKEPIFTTEDGVDMFDCDKYYYIKKDKVYSNVVNAIYFECSNTPNGNKRFSTKEKAEEYILMNKPCLSVNDVVRYMNNPYSNIKEYDITDLIRLVKSKL